MPTAVVSSDLDCGDDDVEGAFVNETYRKTDQDVAMQPVTPEYHRAIDVGVCDIMTMPPVAAHRRLFLPTYAEEERHNTPPFIVPMPITLYDGMMMPMPSGSSFLPPPMPEYVQARFDNETACVSFAMKDDKQGCESSRILFGCDKAVEVPETPPRPDAWTKQVEAAKEFRELHGHCCIPYKYPPNPSLVRFHLLSFVVRYTLPHCADRSLCFKIFSCAFLERLLGLKDNGTSIPYTNALSMLECVCTRLRP